MQREEVQAGREEARKTSVSQEQEEEATLYGGQTSLQVSSLEEQAQISKASLTSP